MKHLVITISVLCLLLTLIPAFLVFGGLITLDMSKTLMLIGTVGWFATSPSWMNKKTGDVA